MKKVQTTLGNIMSLDSAVVTVNNRLTALRTTHSQRLTAKVSNQLLSHFALSDIDLHCHFITPTQCDCTVPAQ